MSKSVQLSVTEADPDDPQRHDVRALWKKMFRKDDRDERRERSEHSTELKGETAQEEDEDEPVNHFTKIKNIGDQAYWSTSENGGALFILKADKIIRISVGGTDSFPTKLSRSKILGASALFRLAPPR